jgi:hypothetical protein
MAAIETIPSHCSREDGRSVYGTYFGWLPFPPVSKVGLLSNCFEILCFNCLKYLMLNTLKDFLRFYD